uniref:Uncharacterized protein n=1 Tax=Anguilla anguilla TaxID=7936 RepID=A0A0E9WXN2_ANGAN
MREANGTENLFQNFWLRLFFVWRRSEKRRRWRVDTPTRQQHGEQTKLSVSGWSLINHSVPGADLWQGERDMPGRMLDGQTDHRRPRRSLINAYTRQWHSLMEY